MNREQLRHLLAGQYNREQWKDILNAVFPHVSLLATPVPIPVTGGHAEAFNQLGSARLADGKNLSVFEVLVSDHTNILRNRVELRKLVTRHIDQQTNHGVLVIFDSRRGDYRFTFAARESTFTAEGDYIEKETAPKRYTYVLGPGETCRTPADRFYELSCRKDTATLDDVVEAFSVEKLNKEFFSKYKEHYNRFTGYLLQSGYRHTVFGLSEQDDSPQAEKRVRDFIKKLMGRIVFLHFIQKKGWLGCPSDRTDWTHGNQSFLNNLFVSCSDSEKFHSKCLIPLFYRALNLSGRTLDIFEPTGSRVPYLNGGLFEQDFEKESEIDFPAVFFKDLLDFFGQYNFTIDENDPDDHEVGIDPEMLGHIFENLLEDNKDKGAFYTPKAIVQYMCRQSLVRYLKNHLGDDLSIDELIELKTRGDEKDRNNFIIKNAPEIEQLLDDVKICDPAIGSGAFAIGLLQEIYWTKLTLDCTLDRAALKRQIIQNSIYGVDIDAGAVEIARLRFWLALIVDEEQPRPLPNLDYKIMQGNSLLESFEGIDLDRMLEPVTGTDQLLSGNKFMLDFGQDDKLATEERRENIRKIMVDYFSETDTARKQQLHMQMDRFALDRIDHNLQIDQEDHEDGLSSLQKEIKRKQEFASAYRPSKKEQKKMEDLERQLAENRLRKEKLHELEHKPERPFFLWHLYFNDVLSAGGFDIVIANPPYVRQETFTELKPALEKKFDCYTGTADLFVYFYEQSARILKEKGILTFISSNKYYRAAYGARLREYLADTFKILTMIDFGDAPVFEAIAYASIFIASKEGAAPRHSVQAYTWDCNDNLGRIRLVMEEKCFPVTQADLTPDGWRLESPVVMRLLEKIRSAGTPLGEYVKGRFYYGIKTGLNEAFVVDRATRDRLIAEHPSSEEVLKPFLRGKDVKRWRVDSKDMWLVYIPWHFPLHIDDNIKGASEEAERVFKKQYPAIFKHLSKYRKQLEARNKAETGIRYEWYALQRWGAEYWEEFEKPKIFIPAIVNKNSYAVDLEGFFGNDKTSICVSEESHFLCGLLNSSLYWWLIQKSAAERQNGFFEFKPMYVSQLPIPDVPAEVKNQISDLVQIALKSPSSHLPQIESQIDTIVESLFNLTPQESQIIHQSVNNEVTATAKSDFHHALSTITPQLPPYLESIQFSNIISLHNIPLSPASFSSYLSEAVQKELIFDAGRGWYSTLKTPLELDTKPVSHIIKQLSAAFPLAAFSCWSTAQLNAYTQHLLNRFVTFVHTEPDLFEPFAEVLRKTGYRVYTDPGKAEAEKSFFIDKDTVVLRKAITKQPEDENHVAPIEKILVDLVWESGKLPIIDESEAHRICTNAINAGRVNMAELLGYANRRTLDFSWIKLSNNSKK